jgi:hypothetical protein
MRVSGHDASSLDKNVANRKPVSYTSSLTGSDAGNYLLSPYTTTVKATITPRQLTLAGMTVAADKAYDGTTVALVTWPEG